MRVLKSNVELKSKRPSYRYSSELSQTSKITRQRVTANHCKRLKQNIMCSSKKI